MNILVTALKIVNSGPLKAFADVTIDMITIRGFRVVEKEGQMPWVGFPQIVYEKNGKTIYRDIIEVPRGLKKAISEKILTAYSKAQEGKPY